MRSAKKVKGALNTRVEVTDSNKRKLHDAEENEATPEVMVPKGASIAVVHYVIPIKLSMGFNSVGVTVGIEMPWPVRPGHPEDTDAGFLKSAEWVERRLTRKAKELPGLLRDLAAKRSQG